MIPTSQAEARASTERFLASRKAEVSEYGHTISGTWNAGWRVELQFCRLGVLVAQLEAATVDAASLERHVEAVAAQAQPLAQWVLSRALALAIVAADHVDPELEEGLDRFQRPARAFVTPVVVDLSRGEVRTSRIGVRGNGFQPQRDLLLRELFAVPVLVG